MLTATLPRVELISKFDKVSDRKAGIKAFEDQGDAITYDLYKILDNTFITPLDREDVSKLTEAADGILDYIDSDVRASDSEPSKS